MLLEINILSRFLDPELPLLGRKAFLSLGGGELWYELPLEKK